jgi:hypothetical protein
MLHLIFIYTKKLHTVQNLMWGRGLLFVARDDSSFVSFGFLHTFFSKLAGGGVIERSCAMSFNVGVTYS